MPYATVDDLADYMGVGDFGNREARAETTLRLAANEVKGIAPAPIDPSLLPDYEERAADAEKMVAEYLITSGGFRTSSSKGLSGLSKGEGYADMDRVRKIIIGAMGPHATANKSKPAIASRMTRRG